MLSKHVITQAMVKSDEEGNSNRALATHIVLTVGSMLTILTLVIYCKMRNQKFNCCLWKNAHTLVDGHDYTYIDLGDIALSSIITQREICPVSQSMGDLMESRNTGRELPPIPRAHSNEDIQAIFEEIATLSQSLPQLIGSILDRDLPPIPRATEYLGGAISSPHILHSAEDNEHSHLEEKSDNDNGYLPSTGSREMLSTGSRGFPTENNDEVCPEQSDIESKSNNTDQDIEDQEYDDASCSGLIENEYAGLEQDNFSDTSSRSSTGILYTLLHGVQRAAATNPDPDLTKVEMNDDDRQKDVDPEKTTDKTPAQDEDEEDGKDEHGYLVLLSDDAPSLQGKRDTKYHESDAIGHGVKAETDTKSEKLVYSEVPPECETKVENVVDQANVSEINNGEAASVLSGQDEQCI